MTIRADPRVPGSNLPTPPSIAGRTGHTWFLSPERQEDSNDGTSNMGKQVINAARIVLYRIEESPRPAVKGRGTLAIESACISRYSILAENRLASMTEHGKYELGLLLRRSICAENPAPMLLKASRPHRH